MRYLLIVLATILVSACGQSDPVPETTSEKKAASNSLVEKASPDSADLLRQAETVFAEAKAAGNAWTVAADRLQDARKAQASGDSEATIGNASETIRLVELSQAQADAEVSVWQQRVPK